MPSYWFGEVEADACIPFQGDALALVSRIRSINPGADIPLQQPDWELAVRCGACSGRTDYIAKLHNACIILAEQEVQNQYSGKDVELLQMVRTLDEMDTVINLLSERVAEWYQTRYPAFSRKYRRTSAQTLIRTINQKSRGALGKVAGEVEALSSTRLALAKEVSARANEVMPNTSALIGGLVAARLMAQAGGLAPLARLPASAIQVIGARTALFAHIRTNTPPPKHGIIFQHRRVHNAPKAVRGKVARVLAGKLAIAARIDLYRGVAVSEFLESAQTRIDGAGKRGEP